MGILSQLIFLRVPVRHLYGGIKAIDPEVLRALGPLASKVGWAPIVEDVENDRIVKYAEHLDLRLEYSFKPMGDNTETNISVHHGLLFKKEATILLSMAIHILKAMEIGYLSVSGAVKSPNACSKCGKDLQPEFAVCPFCGAPR